MNSILPQLLQTLHIATTNNGGSTNSNIDKGVAQGGPLHPTLINTFMETLADELGGKLRISVNILPQDCMLTMSYFA